MLRTPNWPGAGLHVGGTAELPGADGARGGQAAVAGRTRGWKQPAAARQQPGNSPAAARHIPAAAWQQHKETHLHRKATRPNKGPAVPPRPGCTWAGGRL